MVYGAVWHSYEPNEKLYHELINKVSERIDMYPNPYVDQCYMGQEGTNQIFIMHIVEESQTSIQWTHSSY